MAHNWVRPQFELVSQMCPHLLKAKESFPPLTPVSFILAPLCVSNYRLSSQPLNGVIENPLAGLYLKAYPKYYSSDVTFSNMESLIASRSKRGVNGDEE